jgi:hypothetical protein
LEDEEDLDPELAAKINAFFVAAEDEDANFYRTRDPRPILALAEKWLSVTGRDPAPTTFGAVVTLASELQAGFHAGAPASYLNLSIAAWEAMTLDQRFKTASGLSQAVTWNNLAYCLCRRLATEFAAEDDIDHAVAAQRQAVAVLPPDAPNYAQYYGQLSLCLWRRHQLRGESQDLEESVQLLKTWSAREQDPVKHAQAVRCLSVAAARADDPACLASTLDALKTLCLGDTDAPAAPVRNAAALAAAIKQIAYVAGSSVTLDVIDGFILSLEAAKRFPHEARHHLDDGLALVDGLRLVRRYS